MSDTQLLAELNRVKVLFQARTIAAILGLPQPMTLPLTTTVAETNDGL